MLGRSVSFSGRMGMMLRIENVHVPMYTRYVLIFDCNATDVEIDWGLLEDVSLYSRDPVGV